MRERALSVRCDRSKMLDLRYKFLEQAKRYFGVPYKQKYHQPGTEEFDAPLFLDCCGLVRRVLLDLKEDFGFTVGPWNQAYQFDTLPIVIDSEGDMKPGDLVFISAVYHNPKRKPQKHNMVHVEIWAGDGEKTIGARWQRGKVQVHDSYRFEAKSYHSMVYHFRSIDTWLQGICKSYCKIHPWRRSNFKPSKRSIFGSQMLQQGAENGTHDDVALPARSSSLSLIGHPATPTQEKDEDAFVHSGSRSIFGSKMSEHEPGNGSKYDVVLPARPSILSLTDPPASPSQGKDEDAPVHSGNSLGDAGGNLDKHDEHPCSNTDSFSGHHAGIQKDLLGMVSVELVELDSVEPDDICNNTSCRATQRLKDNSPLDSPSLCPNSPLLSRAASIADLGCSMGGDLKTTNKKLWSQSACPMGLEATVDATDMQATSLPDMGYPLGCDSTTTTSTASWPRSPYPMGLETAEGQQVQNANTSTSCPQPACPIGPEATRAGKWMNMSSVTLTSSKDATGEYSSLASDPGASPELALEGASFGGFAQSADDDDDSDILEFDTVEGLSDDESWLYDVTLSESDYWSEWEATKDLPISRKDADLPAGKEGWKRSRPYDAKKAESIYWLRKSNISDLSVKCIQDDGSVEGSLTSGISFIGCNDAKSPKTDWWLEKMKLNETGGLSTNEQIAAGVQDFLRYRKDIDVRPSVKNLIQGGTEVDVNLNVEKLAVQSFLEGVEDKILLHISKNGTCSQSDALDHLSSVGYYCASQSQDEIDPKNLKVSLEDRGCLRSLRKETGIESGSGSSCWVHDGVIQENLETPKEQDVVSRDDLDLQKGGTVQEMGTLFRSRSLDSLGGTVDNKSENRHNSLRAANTPSSFKSGGLEFTNGKSPLDSELYGQNISRSGFCISRCPKANVDFVSNLNTPVDSDSPEDASHQHGDGVTNQESASVSGDMRATNGKAAPDGNDATEEQDGKRNPPVNADGRKSVFRVNNAPLFFIGGHNGVSLVEDPLLEKGWQRLDDGRSDRFKLRWVEVRGQINYTTFRPGEQLINRIPGSGLLATKTGLFNTLREYERLNDRFRKTTDRAATKGLRMSDFFPESYVLDLKADREKFFEIFKEGDIWICKPNNMNQGKGIYLVRDLEELRKKYANEGTAAGARSKVKRGTNQRLIQRYLPNPLLLNGKKFDIRVYMLIACTSPFVVLYHPGYCRLSCEDYDPESKDLARHLTNQYQQKRVPQYQDMKNETVWSMERFNDYINTELAEQHGLPTDWVFGHFTKRMRQVMSHCFHAVKSKLDTSLGLFDLLGFDFIIDADMKIWLLEVNVNPALHTNCDVLKEKLPPMIAETLDITLEVFEKSRRGQKILPITSLRNFHLLYSAPSRGSRGGKSPQRSKSISPVRTVAKSPVRRTKTKSNQSPKGLSVTKETRRVKSTVTVGAKLPVQRMEHTKSDKT